MWLKGTDPNQAWRYGDDSSGWCYLVADSSFNAMATHSGDYDMGATPGTFRIVTINDSFAS